MAVRTVLILVLSVLMASSSGNAQFPPGEQGSRNIRVLSHIPLGRVFTVGNIDIEQELSRPYAYVPRWMGIEPEAGFQIVSLEDPTQARVIYKWQIEDVALHTHFGCLSGKYFKTKGRYYYAQGCQFGQGGPNADLGAVVFDVTGLPDTSTVREVGRLRVPGNPTGFHEVFAYKHSDGRVLLFGTDQGGTPPFPRRSPMYDMDRFLAGDADQGFVGFIPLPEAPGSARDSYHDMFVGYDPVSRQDRFYGAGGGGYFVFDITQPEEPRLLTSVTGVAGVTWGHTFTPSPDGRYVVAETEYQYAPLRIFDLKPGLDGEVETISQPIGAWTARWQGCPHNTEVRWPYVFVSAYEDGLYVFNWMDPANPYTVAYYDTFDGPHERGRTYDGSPEHAWEHPNWPTATVTNGAFGVDVRNADGLIVISDLATGFWAFKMDGFDGWNGHQWGMPNVSSAQDWDNGPDGAARRVSTILPEGFDRRLMLASMGAAEEAWLVGMEVKHAH